MKINICFLLISMSVWAQYTKSPFYKTLDSINSILYQNRTTRFIDTDNNYFYLRKIKANTKGDIHLIDSLTSDYKKNNHLIFNVLNIKEFKMDGNKIQLLDQKNQKVGTIINVEIQYMKPIIKQLVNLTVLCEKQEAIDYIKSYYADFSTGSDQYSYDYGITKPGYEREYRKFTGNYNVEINDCKFKMTFDTYKWPYEEWDGTTVVAFDLMEIDSISEGLKAVQSLTDQPEFSIEINAAISFHFHKNKNATVLYKGEKEELLEKAATVSLKIYKYPNNADFTDTKIVKAFKRLQELCNK